MPRSGVRATPQGVEKVPQWQHRDLRYLAGTRLQADTEIALELVFLRHGMERFEILQRDVSFGFHLDRGMIAQNKIDLKARGRPPVADRLPRDVVSITDQLMHKVGLERLTKFGRAEA